MIPTQYKAKLGRELSYPLGAMEITEALAGAPHVEDLSLGFYREAVRPASEFRQILDEERPYAVVVGEYRPRRPLGYSGSHYLAEAGFYDEKWELHVYPVLREARHAAHRLLIEQGLPAISRWLRSSKPTTWCQHWQRLEMILDPAAEILTARESNGM